MHCFDYFGPPRCPDAQQNDRLTYPKAHKVGPMTDRLLTDSRVVFGHPRSVKSLSAIGAILCALELVNKSICCVSRHLGRPTCSKSTRIGRSVSGADTCCFGVSSCSLEVMRWRMCGKTYDLGVFFSQSISTQRHSHVSFGPWTKGTCALSARSPVFCC